MPRLAGSAMLIVLLATTPAADAGSRARQESLSARDARLVLSVDAGEAHTCTVRGDGTVRCWGLNSDGQLGNNSTVDSPTPVTVWDITTAVAVSAGTTHTCALLADGTVRCWGANSNGQLGNDSTRPSRVPVRVRGLTGAVSIATGSFHTCAVLADGTVRCWGANSEGQLGDRTLDDRRLPVIVLDGPLGSSALLGRVAIAAGAGHTCATSVGGQVRCWGQNAFGQLGDGTTVRRTSPATVYLGPSRDPLSGATAIAAGAFHTCVAFASGTASCWGDNSAGQINGSGVNQLYPVAITDLTNVVTVTAGTFHTCALRATGGAVCLGDNDFGQLGDGTFTSRSFFGAVRLSNAAAISAGGAHGCAALADGSIRCWGLNSSGQLGNQAVGQTSNRPVLVEALDPDVPEVTFVSGRDIAAGGTHTCALRATGIVSCWGGNDAGQTGRDASGAFSVPDTVGGLGNVQAIAAGHRHTCALNAAGSVLCWGLNDTGQLGDTTTDDRGDPRSVGGLATQALAVAPGIVHTCALLATGQVRCWGGNAFGQLGDGTEDELSTVPRIVGLDVRAIAIAAGGGHGCAVGVDTFVYCWGFNLVGQLGVPNASTVQRTPVRTTLASAVAIAAGAVHTCALLVGGEVFCWGFNADGQLGIGSTDIRFAPDLVVDLAGAVAIAAGGAHTCALESDGRVRCWGDNRSGQLGNGSRTDSSRPVRVRNLANAVAITAGQFHTCALRADGAVFCWGENSGDEGTGAGQLGDGTTQDRLEPVEVGGFRANVAPTATLATNGRRVLLTAVVNCPVGHTVAIDMAVEQDGGTAVGGASGQCMGGLTGYPVQVQVRQGDPFGPGDAVAEITATVRHGRTVADVQEWTRKIEIQETP